MSAALSSDARLLVFPLDEVPERPNGGVGVQLLALPEKETLASVAATDGKSLVVSGIKRKNRAVETLDAKQLAAHGQARAARQAGRRRLPRRSPGKLEQPHVSCYHVHEEIGQKPLRFADARASRRRPAVWHPGGNSRDRGIAHLVGPPMPESLAGLFILGPYALLAIAVALAWVFNRGRASSSRRRCSARSPRSNSTRAGGVHGARVLVPFNALSRWCCPSAACATARRTCGSCFSSARGC